VITYSGRQLDMANFKAADVSIRDIAKSLSLTCRWCGHLGVHYSVAQHCYMLARYAASEAGYHSPLAKMCLLHDSSEAYLSDISFGVKHLLPDYMKLEEHVQGTIYAKYLGYNPEGHSLQGEMKSLDHRLAVAEYLDVKAGSKQEDLAMPHKKLERLDVQVKPMPAARAEIAFLQTARAFGFVTEAEVSFAQ